MLVRLHNGRFKGSAFIGFANPKVARNALKLTGTSFAGKEILVEEAHGKAAASSPARLSVAGAASAAIKPSRSVRVSNLPTAVNEKLLRGAFSDCGQIQRVNLLKALDPSVLRTAFVDFRHQGAAEAAVALDGACEIQGRKLAVSYSSRATAPLSSRRSQDARRRRRELRETRGGAS